MNGQPLPASHGFPLRLIVPDWYGMASVKWLRSITAIAEPFEGVQQTLLYTYRRAEDEAGDAGHAQAAAGADGAARDARVPLARAPRARRAHPDHGRAWSGAGASAASSSAPTAGAHGPTPAWTQPNGKHGWSGLVLRLGRRRARRARALRPRHRRAGKTQPLDTPRPGTRAATASTRSSACPSA